MSVQKFDPSDIVIHVTPTADAHLIAQLSKQPKALGFRLSTEKTGCSGLGYVTEIVTKMLVTDIKAHSNASVDLFVDQKSVSYLNGLTLDFVQQHLGQAKLMYINPNESGRCGCGESFTVDPKKS